jgi:hypothetical protein
MKRLLALLPLALTGCWSFDADFNACQGSAHCVAKVTAISGICSVDHWCWDSPLPHNALRGVVSPGSLDAWAFGDQATRLHYDGSKWSYVPGTDADLRTAVAFASDQIALATSAGVERWDGTAWTKILEGKPAVAITGTAIDDLWAITGAGDEIRRYDGTTWTLSRYQPGEELRAIFALDKTSVWVVGDAGLILHYDGAAWLPEVSPVSRQFMAVWASSATNVWAAGALGTVLHRNAGGGWDDLTTGTMETLTGISGSSKDDVWFVGIGTTGLHWDGTRFVDAAIEPSASAITITSGVSWAAGRAGGLNRRVQESWVATPNGFSENIFKVHGRAANDAWAVGDNGFVLHFDGTAWTPVDTGGSKSLRGVFAINEDEVWVVGEQGEVRRRMKNKWEPVDGFPKTGLFAVWSAGPGDVWVGGSEGKLVHYTGMSPPTPVELKNETNDIRGISGTDNQHVFVATAGGNVWHGPGTAPAAAWISRPAEPTNGPLNSIFALAPNDVWAAGGGGGDVVHWTGTEWVTVPARINPADSFWGITDDHTGGVWAVGERGYAVRCKGDVCTPIATGARPTLRGVFAPTADVAFAVGDDGVQLRFQP